MYRSTKKLVVCALTSVCGLMLNGAPAMAASIFDISQPTHAVVDAKTDVYPCCGADNSNTFHSGYIYNIFGASNSGVEGSTDMIFQDGHATDFVDFHTATLVNLTSVALTVGSESAGSNGPRGYLGATFQQFTDNTYTTPVGSPYTFSNSGLVPADTPNTLPISITNGQYFQLSMTTNATYNNGGVRMISFTGAGSQAPEPSTLALVGLSGVGLLLVLRRRHKS